VIAVEALRVRYPGAGDDALGGVSFGASRGAVTALVGPNGSGKSTFVRALLGRVPVAGGGILVDGEPAAAIPRRRLARMVAVVGQREEPAFPLLVGDYVAMGRFPWQRPWAAPSAADREAVARALASADVVHLAARRTDTLSGGEWQRVRIARALAQQADAIVLDEPTSFLDIAHEMAASSSWRRSRTPGAASWSSATSSTSSHASPTRCPLARGRAVASGPPAEVRRGETLERVYAGPLVVSRDPAVGAPTLVPLRKPHAPIP